MNSYLLPNPPYLYLSNKAGIQVYERFRQRTISDYTSPQIIFRIIYHHEDEVNCPICLEIPTLPRVNKCGHIFCLSCLMKLVEHEADSPTVLCPLCKSCHISASTSKRVFLRRVLTIRVGKNTTFKLLAKGKSSKFPDFYDNLPSPYPYAPYNTDPSAEMAPISVISDKGVLQELKRDKTIGERSRSHKEIAKFLNNEQLEFRSSIEKTDPRIVTNDWDGLLNSFNFSMELDRQLDRFDLFYQSLDHKYVFLEPSLTTQLITTHKQKGLLAEINGEVIKLRTEKMTPSIQKETDFLNIPLGTIVTFATVNIGKLQFKYSTVEKYVKAKQVRDTISKNAAQFAKVRQESQIKQRKLKTQGIVFTPMAQSSSYVSNNNTAQPDNDSPASYNLCMFGLECDDPDDDYPHDVRCYRYHDAYRRKEFHENFFTEDDPLI